MTTRRRYPECVRVGHWRDCGKKTAKNFHLFTGATAVIGAGDKIGRAVAPN
jgi:hypothetical protein